MAPKKRPAASSAAGVKKRPAAGDVITRTHVRPAWHKSFPPKELLESPDAVAEWLANNVPAPKPPPQASARERMLVRMSAQEYINARRAGEVTCLEFATALVARMLHYRYMNQFMYWDVDPQQHKCILAQADALDKRAAKDGLDAIAPLYGLPIPAKGTMATTDFNSSAGSGLLHGYRAKRDAALVKLLRGAGGVVMGKTNTPEFAASWVTANYANGRTLNPYDHQLTTGGSSGGAGSAVATYICPIAISEDTGGSTRHPATQCHNYGYDPSRNHYPNAGNPGMSYTNDQVGFNARHFGDILLVDAALLSTSAEHAAAAHAAPVASAVQVGFPIYPFVQNGEERVSVALEEKYLAVKDLLAKSGVQVVEQEWPDVEVDGQKLNTLQPWIAERTVNGRKQTMLGAERGVAFHSFSGQMAAWVASYLEAPVSNVDLVADMMPIGHALNSASVHMREEHDEDESIFRYWVATQPDRVKAWNSYFDAHGADVIMTPPQKADAFTYAGAAAAKIPIRIADDSGGYKLEERSYDSSNYLHYFAFKSIPIPKLVVPTGLDATGKPTAVEFWGRAVPADKLYDDEFAKTFDLDFLYKVKPLVELIEAEPSLRRAHAPLVADLFS